MGGELSEGVVTGGDGEGAGADGTGAGDVVRGVADDPDARKVEVMTGDGGGAGEGVGAEVVAVGAVIGKGAEGKVVPEGEVAEFHAGAALEVAGEQALVDGGVVAGGVEEGGDAGENVGAAVELGREAAEVAVDEAVGVGRSVGNREFFEDAGGDPAVGATGPIDVGEVAGNAKVFTERDFESAQPGAAGVEECAVDIPKEKGWCH